MATKRANGEGSIRQKANGRWEGRLTVGRDFGTGKPISRSFYGATQAEVRKKMTEAAHAVDEKAYIKPSKLTVVYWLAAR